MSISNNKPKSKQDLKTTASLATDNAKSARDLSAVENDFVVESDSANSPAQESVAAATEQTTSDELSFVHDAVLLQETVAAVLDVKSLPKQPDDAGQNSLQMSGIYVDATFGRGGHSRLLLSQLADDATLIVFDKDPTAISVARELASSDSRAQR